MQTSEQLDILRDDLAKIFYGATRDNVKYILDDQITALDRYKQVIDLGHFRYCIYIVLFVFSLP